jgi:tetratricopeptide (TPR) repeat protein
VDTAAPVVPSSLSEDMRAVYKVSSEKANEESDRRTQLLAQSPELAALDLRIQQNPADKEARSQLVAAYFDHQMHWAAYELLSAVEAKNEADSETSLGLARIWDVWGQYDLALKFGERAIAEGDSSARTLDVMGRIQLHRNDPAAAITWYTRAAQQGDSATIQANLGYAYLLVSDWAQAKATLEKAIALDGSLPEAHNNLAVVLIKLGDDKAALSELVKTAPAHVAFNNMGVLYLQEEQLVRAREYFEEALRLAPGYEIAERNLTDVEALLPVGSPVGESLDNAPEDVKEKPQMNCPVVDAVVATLAETEPLPRTIDVDFMGSLGMVEAAPIPEPMFSDVVAPVRVKIKKPRATEEVTGNVKDGDGGESNGIACPSTTKSARQKNSWWMVNLDDHRLGLYATIGLLLGAVTFAIRRNRPSVEKITIR